MSEIANWHGHLPFAYDLMQELNPKTMVELGTHYGDSYFTFCQARRELDLETSCYAVDTWKGDHQAGEYGEEVYETVRKINEENYGDFSILRRSTFASALPEFEEESIDLLHIDGLHSYEAVARDFSSWFSKVGREGIVLLHDTMEKHEGFGVWKLWEEISDKYPSFEFTHSCGLGVLRKTNSENRSQGELQIGELRLTNNSGALSYYASQGMRTSLQGEVHRLKAQIARQKLDLEDMRKKMEELKSKTPGNFLSRLFRSD